MCAMRMDAYDSRTCSIARTTEIIGERWTVIILRDLFNGIRRFDDLQRHMSIARDILTKRLTTLIDAGIVEKVAYQDEGARTRYEYHLTQAGRDLIPVMVALMDWGNKYTADDEGPPMIIEHRDCGEQVHAVLTCERGHRIKQGRMLKVVPQAAARLAS